MAQDKYFYQKQEVKDFANETLEEMVNYAKLRFKIPKFEPKMKVSFNVKHLTSYGGYMDGEPVLFIAGTPVLWMVHRKGARRMFDEYNQFKEDPEIGVIKKACWKQWIAAAIAHEISHAIQYYAITHSKQCQELLQPYMQTEAEEHGVMWRDIYRNFRIRYVNHFEF